MPTVNECWLAQQVGRMFNVLKRHCARCHDTQKYRKVIIGEYGPWHELCSVEQMVLLAQHGCALWAGRWSGTWWKCGIWAARQKRHHFSRLSGFGTRDIAYWHWVQDSEKKKRCLWFSLPIRNIFDSLNEMTYKQSEEKHWIRLGLWQIWTVPISTNQAAQSCLLQWHRKPHGS